MSLTGPSNDNKIASDNITDGPIILSINKANKHKSDDNKIESENITDDPVSPHIVEANNHQSDDTDMLSDINDELESIDDKSEPLGVNKVSQQADAQSQPEVSQEGKEGQFKCGICHLLRDSKAKLERHMSNHNEDGDWTCVHFGI